MLFTVNVSVQFIQSFWLQSSLFLLIDLVESLIHNESERKLVGSLTEKLLLSFKFSCLLYHFKSQFKKSCVFLSMVEDFNFNDSM